MRSAKVKKSLRNSPAFCLLFRQVPTVVLQLSEFSEPLWSLACISIALKRSRRAMEVSAGARFHICDALCARTRRYGRPAPHAGEIGPNGLTNSPGAGRLVVLIDSR